MLWSAKRQQQLKKVRKRTGAIQQGNEYEKALARLILRQRTRQDKKGYEKDDEVRAAAVSKHDQIMEELVATKREQMEDLMQGMDGKVDGLGKGRAADTQISGTNEADKHPPAPSLQPVQPVDGQAWSSALSPRAAALAAKTIASTSSANAENTSTAHRAAPLPPQSTKVDNDVVMQCLSLNLTSWAVG